MCLGVSHATSWSINQAFDQVKNRSRLPFDRLTVDGSVVLFFLFSKILTGGQNFGKKKNILSPSSG